MFFYISDLWNQGVQHFLLASLSENGRLGGRYAVEED